LQKSIPAQIRQPVFILGTMTDQLTNFWGSLLVQNDIKKSLCEIRVVMQVEAVAQKSLYYLRA
jgi:hypothetical protein